MSKNYLKKDVNTTYSSRVYLRITSTYSLVVEDNFNLIVSWSTERHSRAVVPVSLWLCFERWRHISHEYQTCVYHLVVFLCVFI